MGGGGGGGETDDWGLASIKDCVQEFSGMAHWTSLTPL